MWMWTYDTFTYVRKIPKSAAEKTKWIQICRFAQFPDERKQLCLLFYKNY